MSDTKLICPNCGAEINSADTKCPYCGYINEEGAEKAYMDHLYDIKDDLDKVDEAAAAEYGKGYSKTIKLIMITLITLLIISGIVFAYRLVDRHKRMENDKIKGGNMLDEMAWKRKAFAEFDRLYEQGNYDKLCDEVFAAADQKHDVYEWEHYRFASTYMDYLSTITDLEYADKNGWDEFGAKTVFYKCCLIYYRDDMYKYGDLDYKLTDEEKEKLEPVIEYMNNVLHERLGFTDEDMADLKGSLVDDNNCINYDECTKVAVKHMDQFK